MTKRAEYTSKSLFPMCNGCAKRYPACQDTCPDAEPGRKKKKEIYEMRLKNALECGANKVAHDRFVKKHKLEKK